MGSPDQSPQEGLPSRSEMPIGHDILVDAPRVPHPIDLTRKNALARALTTDYLGVDRADFTDITYGMVDYIKPEHLAPYLIGVPVSRGKEDNPNVIGYYAGPRQGYIHLAVTPQEAKLMPRGVDAIRKAARITTGATVTTPFPTDQDLGRADRSGAHAHETKLGSLVALRDNVYRPQRLILDKFIEASEGNHFGLARFGDEGKLRGAMATLRTQIFGDIVLAYGHQRHLSGSQMKRMDKAITASICLQDDPKDNRITFAQLVRFARGYNGHKLAATEQRIEAIEKQLS